MKKIQLLVCLLAFAFSAKTHAQGTINFANSSSTYVVTNNFLLGTTGRASSALGTRVQLYYGSVGSAEAQLIPVGTPVGMGLPGIFSGGSITLPGIAEGANAVFEVRGWTGGYASYDAAYAAATQGNFNILLGTSAMWTQVTGAPSAVPPTVALMVNGPGGFTGLCVGCMPEPSTYALLGLGLLGFAFKPARKLIRK